MSKKTVYNHVPGTPVVDVESDKKRVKLMTDEEIMRAALDDPDNPPLTDEQLRRFRRVNPNLKAE